MSPSKKGRKKTNSAVANKKEKVARKENAKWNSITDQTDQTLIDRYLPPITRSQAAAQNTTSTGVSNNSPPPPPPPMANPIRTTPKAKASLGCEQPGNLDRSECQTFKPAKKGRKRQPSYEASDSESLCAIQKPPKHSELDKLEPVKNPQAIPPSNWTGTDSLEVIDYECFSPLTRGLIKDLIEEQRSRTPTVREKAQGTCSHNSMLQHISNIDADVKHITSLLDSIFTFLKERSLNLLDCNSQQQKTNYPLKATGTHLLPSHFTNMPQERPPKPEYADFSKAMHTREDDDAKRRVTLITQPLNNIPHSATLSHTQSGKASGSLTYNTTSVAISISPLHGRYVDWSNKLRAKQHIAFLLKKTPYAVDLLGLEKLPSIGDQERFLLHFRSNSIPRQLLSQALKLHSLGIRLHRHFRDSSLQRLIPLSDKKAEMAVKNTPDNSLYTPGTTTENPWSSSDQLKPPDLPIPLELTNVKSPIVSDILSRPGPPTSNDQLPSTESESGILEDEMNDNLLSSFALLPLEEQDSMILRLQSLTNSLKATRRTPTAKDSSVILKSLAQTCQAETSKLKGPPTHEGNTPLEPVVTINKKPLSSNVIVSSNNLELSLISEECSQHQQKDGIGPPCTSDEETVDTGTPLGCPIPSSS